MGAEQTLTCPLCRGSDFEREKGKIDSEFGFTAHRVRIFICTHCRYTLLFSDGRTIFDLD